MIIRIVKKIKKPDMPPTRSAVWLLLPDERYTLVYIQVPEPIAASSATVRFENISPVYHIKKRAFRQSQPVLCDLDHVSYLVQPGISHPY